MIFVDGVPLSANSCSNSQEIDTLLALLENPILVSASTSFKATPEKKFSLSEESGPGRSKWVYLFQREYATVDPALVDFVGTDEATTCVGLVIRNRRNGMTSLAHMDSPKIVDTGLSQMLSLLIDDSLDTELDVHLVGGFEDFSLKHANGSSISESHADLDGYSFPLCKKIVQTLRAREEKFHIQTICVLGHNTRRDSDGNAYPIFNGFVVETSTGLVIPASFDRSSRCPDEIVRRIRVSASYEDPSWKGKLLETYDTGIDQFKIAPCRWTLSQYQIALTLRHHSDSEILSICSTSPTAEGPDFVDTMKRQWDYIIEHPYWSETFPMKQHRIFERTPDGAWKSWKQWREAKGKYCLAFYFHLKAKLIRGARQSCCLITEVLGLYAWYLEIMDINKGHNMTWTLKFKMYICNLMFCFVSYLTQVFGEVSDTVHFLYCRMLDILDF